MEPFSKLRPPDSIRIKVRLAESHDDTCSINSNISTVISSADECTPNGYSLFFKNSKKFCVDPEITSYEILLNLIAQAFGLKEDFKMNYLNREIFNESNNSIKGEFISLHSDWDLDAAFLNSSKPYLAILLTPTGSAKISTVRTSSDPNTQTKIQQNYDEWEMISTQEIKPTIITFPISDCRSVEYSNKKEINRSGSFNDQSIRRNLFSLWSVTAADKAVSVFNKMLSGFSRSNSFTSTTSSNQSHQYVHSHSSNSCNQSYSQYNPHSYASPPKTENIPIEAAYLFNKYTKPPLTDAEYKNFIDSDGRVVHFGELRQRIFDGGCDPTRRKDIWPMLLDIYPSHSLTAKQRIEFIADKSNEYNQLKSSLWFNLNKSILKNQKMFNIFDKEMSTVDTDKLSVLANKIQKDVWRTDRYHRFYSGDSNKNVEVLFNILMTYALENGGFYAQGMSDMLSPLLFVLREEPLSYICFKSLMKRCSSNFDILSEEIANKIGLLTALIARYDSVFWMYLMQYGVDQLFFTYRWLLIECKREFPFNDSLRVLEVMWSSIDAQKINNTDSCSFRSFKTRSNSDTSSVNIQRFKQNSNEKISPSNQSDDYQNSDVEFGEKTSFESAMITNQTTSPFMSRNRQLSNKITSFDECIYEVENEVEISKRVNSEKIDIQTNESPEETTTSNSESESSLDESDIKGLDEAAFKLNRQRWKFYKRTQHANKIRTRRPRYFSLNIMASTEKSNLLNYDSGHATENEKKPLEKQQEKSIFLCLSNLELKKRQLEDKYKTHNPCGPLAATNYLLNKNIPHTCKIKNKNRSSSSSCIHCICHGNEENNQSAKILKNSKKRNSLFGSAAANTLLSALPRLINLSNMTSGSDSLNRSRRHVLGNIGENENLDSDLMPEKIGPKKKLRKKARDILKKPKKLNDIIKPNQKIQLVRKDSHETDEIIMGRKIDVVLVDEEVNQIKSKSRLSNSASSNEKLTSSPNSCKSSSQPSSTTSAVGSSVSSLSSTCSTPFLATKTPKPSSFSQPSFLITKDQNPSQTPESPKPLQQTPSSQQASCKNDQFEDSLEEELIYSISKLDNPFLLFICFSIFIEHRDHIMRSQLDANDIACYFDKMLRKHNMKSILSRARYLYTKLYLSKTNAFSYMQQLNEISNSP